MRRLFLALSIFALIIVSYVGSHSDASETNIQQAALSENVISNDRMSLDNLFSNKIVLNYSPVGTAYSFCGACTSHSDCGPGNRCCAGNCPTGKYKCYKVDTC